MASITSLGVGSGLDLDNLISNILSAERAPAENRLNLQETETQASISAYGSLKSTLANFQRSLDNLADADFFSSRKTTVSDPESFTAMADSNAESGSYNIQVMALAKASKLVSTANYDNPNATVGEGILTIGLVGGNSFDVTVAADDSLADLVDAINNAASNVGITASLLTIDLDTSNNNTNTEIVLTSDNTGEANQITISVVDTGDGDNINDNGLSQFHFADSGLNATGNQLTNESTAQDAHITVDGFNTYSSSNVFDSVIDGVTITAVSADNDPLNPSTARLDIAADNTAVKSAITTFAASYNELMMVINELTDYDTETGDRAILGSDSSARLIEQQLRRIMTSTIEGAPEDFNHLSYLGFSTNRDGTISLTEESTNSYTANLNDALSANFDKFGSLFSGENGVATQLNALLDSFLQSGGTIATREATLKEELNVIEQQRLDLEFRLEKIEARYRSQFAALDLLVGQLNQTGNFLSEQLKASAGIISSIDND
ncbi:flagellar filament capping protein FliD [uncultured Oceanicoccus sp.]|uniref:flagellar filament capping protein FliD n=1 Tax=uncultured Oceanicoccus sp. TaxID=1706381 RepID=UPI0030D79D6E